MDIQSLLFKILWGTIAATLLTAAILFVKKVFLNHISTQMHYKIWQFIYVPLLMPFLPFNMLHPAWLLQNIERLNWYSGTIGTQEGKVRLWQNNTPAGSNTISDLSVSVSKALPDLFYNIIGSVWLIGMLVLAFRLIVGFINVQRVRSLAIPVQEEKILGLFNECKRQVGVNRNIKLLETEMFAAPITFGVIGPFVLIPKRLNSPEVLQHVFLHELSHQKNKDTLINYLTALVQIIYWFNPIVWYVASRMRTERELACDHRVLSLLNTEDAVKYGQTIISFANIGPDRVDTNLVSGIGGSKKQIKKRIVHIANFNLESNLLKRKSKMICTAIGCFVLILSMSMPALAASSDKFDFDFEKYSVKNEDLTPYFKDVEGSFVLYNSGNGQYEIFNRDISTKRVSPNSTYKIYSALFALDAGIITPELNGMKWNGSEQPFSKWRRDQNLDSAIRDSVNWYFQNLDKKVGNESLQRQFERIHYGNEDVSGDVSSYWMESTLKVSPIEQVQLLVHTLENNRYGFKEKDISQVKQSMFIEEKDSSRLYGKTGTGTVEGKDINGWFVGFVEKKNKIYTFAVNIQSNIGEANGKNAAEIARRILHDKGIF
ncbi:BlaR1 family beta-lactam sensor/signal transducer [Aciduricibacillus chroicocephali]|uniref:BlaR1 family beta-lactam sensor/signal transducer n=1 Tax=Aciduricibacillus chroicocephali TaxID=3054939 RepID=A0ABY9KSR7_9BACI|nr:BlaR1 family beta-lactam sensor/signal transducer [Bacillaceae bacterium 44XB]